MDPGTALLQDVQLELRRHKELADKALADLSDEAFFRHPAEHVNPIALIVKHLAGNLISRWTDFLTTDGDKPTRDRDAEFVLTATDTRADLMSAWDRGWQAILATIQNLTPADLTREITIRGERHTARQALLRGLNHAVYHIGQILYLARLFAPDRPWLTIAPGKSREHRAAYLAVPSSQPRG